jgi:hypothetical protein
MRAPRSGPQTTTTPRPTARPAPPKNTRQAKARAKARKAKAPKVARTPLRERLIARLASVDLRPRTLAAKVPFVVLIIGSLGVGLGISLWLSTDAAERSYQLGSLREENKALLQQKESLERDVLEAQSAPALAEAARNLGMVPSRDTAHLVQDPAGNWVVVGSPKPAEGAPPPPLNTKLPEEQPSSSQAPGAPWAEVPVRVPPGGSRRTSPTIPGFPAPAPEVLLRAPDGATTLGSQHLPDVGATAPGGPAVPLAAPAPEPAPAVSAPPVSDASPGVEQFGPPVTTATPGAAR